MSRIGWNKPGERFFEVGVDRGVYYPRVGRGVPWNGLVSVNEQAVGGEVESLYFDGVKYMDFANGEDFEATIEAYNAPREFAASDGVKYLVPGLSVGQQPRKPFGLAYRTLIGNDLDGVDHGYKIHLVYNCTASPAPRSAKTLAGAAAPETRTWKIDAVPPPSSTFRPTAHIVLDSTQIEPYLMATIEMALYGRDAQGSLPARDPYLPTVEQIVAMFNTKVTATVTATV